MIELRAAKRLAGLCLAMLAAAAAAPSAGLAMPPEHAFPLKATVMLSVTPAGDPAEGDSIAPAISADGRVVAFETLADDIISWGPHGDQAVVVRDIETSTTSQVSIGPGGQGFSHWSSAPAIAGSGRYVTFASHPEHGWDRIYRRDLEKGVTEVASIAEDGLFGRASGIYPGSVSSRGRLVAYSDIRGKHIDRAVVVHDMRKGTEAVASIASDGTSGDGWKSEPRMSANGRSLAFSSNSTNLVPDDTNGQDDIFVHDMRAGTTLRASVASDGTQSDGSSGDLDSLSLSADGRHVCFASFATNLVADDTNGYRDVFCRDLDSGETVRTSVSTSGAEADGQSIDVSVSGDGRFVAFGSYATNLDAQDDAGEQDVYVHDMETGVTMLVSPTMPGASTMYGNAYDPDISADGRFLAFNSGAAILDEPVGHPWLQVYRVDGARAGWWAG